MKITISEKQEKQYTISEAPAGFSRMVINGNGQKMNLTYLIHKNRVDDMVVTLFYELFSSPQIMNISQFASACRFEKVEGDVTIAFGNDYCMVYYTNS